MLDIVNGKPGYLKTLMGCQ